MFFIVSKVVWFLVAPTNFFIVLLCLGAILLGREWKRAGGCMIGVSAALFVLCGPGPVGALLTIPLENRFPAPVEAPSHVAGLIVLGGGINPQISAARGEVVLTPAGTRLTETAVAARRFPQARVIFTGGGGRLVSGPSEAQFATAILVAMGVSPDRIILEAQSQNSWQNAIFTRAIVHPRPGQKWLLITSAIHMPRAMGVFREAGFDVVAWPAGYMTAGSVSAAFRSMGSAAGGLTLTDAAVHEWLGLVVYRLTGRIRSLFPSPRLNQ